MSNVSRVVAEFIAIGIACTVTLCILVDVLRRCMKGEVCSDCRREETQWIHDMSPTSSSNGTQRWGVKPHSVLSYFGRGRSASNAVYSEELLESRDLVESAVTPFHSRPNTTKSASATMTKKVISHKEENHPLEQVLSIKSASAPGSPSNAPVNAEQRKKGAREVTVDLMVLEHRQCDSFDGLDIIEI